MSEYEADWFPETETVVKPTPYTRVFVLLIEDPEGGYAESYMYVNEDIQDTMEKALATGLGVSNDEGYTTLSMVAQDLPRAPKLGVKK